MIKLLRTFQNIFTRPVRLDEISPDTVMQTVLLVALTKNVKTFCFHRFNIFLSVTADTIKLELIFKIRPKATKVAKRSIHLRNIFRFSEVHGSMNTTDHVQSK